MILIKLFYLSLVLSSAVCSQLEDDFVIFIDNHEGSFLRQEVVQEPMSVQGIVATYNTLLDIRPSFITTPDLSRQMESLLSPNPFSRPEVVFSFQVIGAQDEFTSGSENLQECTCGCAHHLRPLREGSGFSAAIDSLVAEASPAQLQHFSVDCQQEGTIPTCDAQCLEQALTSFAAFAGGEYVQGESPMQGKLKDKEGMELDLMQEDEREVGMEIACLLASVDPNSRASIIPKVENPGEEIVTTRPPRQMLTGTLDSLEGVKAKHGKDSAKIKVASKFLAQAVGQTKNYLRDTFGEKILGHISFLKSKKVDGQQRRHLLQTESARNMEQWQSKAIMTMVGFSLVVITLICTVCMFSMDLQQDTLLYGKTKAE